MVDEVDAEVGTEGVRELEHHLSQMALALFAAGTVDETLRRIVTLAEETIDGCDGAGIFLVEHGTPTTMAASGALVRAVDQLQVDCGEGPCLDASSGGITVYAQDLADDPRWPRFSPTAVEAGVRSVLAYSLSSERSSALNLYAHLPTAFGATDRAQGQLFATLALLALVHASERDAEAGRAEHLLKALGSRELIGQAQGILMERERITSEQAFDVLRRASQHMNVKLRDVAESLVETGATPDTGPRARSQ